MAVKMVRKVALCQAVGQLDGSRRKRRSRKKTGDQYADQQEFAGRIKRVKGSPVLWKELRAPLFRGHKLAAFIIIAIALLFLETYLAERFSAERRAGDTDEHGLGREI